MFAKKENVKFEVHFSTSLVQPTLLACLSEEYTGSSHQLIYKGHKQTKGSASVRRTS